MKRYWSSIFLNTIRKKYQYVSLYSVRISFKIEVYIKTFSDIQSLNEFITSRPAL